MNPMNQPHMTRFRPWKILHLDLRQEIPALPSESGIGGLFVVFWWHDIPLGQRWIPAKQFPMRAPEVREHALTVITPAVGRHLLGCSFEVLSSNRPPEEYGLDLEVLAELERPLHRLQGQLSLLLANTADPSVSVVVCTRDRPEQLKRCLGSLQNLTHNPEEILVVDNAPGSDETRDLVSQFPDVRYIREPKPGLDVARNRGIHKASGDIVAFTDDDATVHPDWIARIRQGFKDPDVMAVAGLVLPAELETEAQYLFETHWGFAKGYQKRVFAKQFFDKARRWGAPVWEIGAGANMAFRRKVFDMVGPFDERLDVGAAGCSGDSEMWYRILAQEWTCRYEPSAVVYHYHRRNMEDFYQQVHDYMRGHVAALLIQFERYRHWGNLRRILVSLPWYYAGLAVNGVLDGFSGRERTLLDEIRGCLSGLRFYLYTRRAGHSIHRMKPSCPTGKGV